VDHARQVAGEGPMWVIPQCFGFGGPDPHGIPAPNEVSLMVWEAVAHGAKGIAYFIYQSTTNIQGEWLQGIVDMQLKPMDHRHAEVRAVNAALSAVAKTLLDLRWQPNTMATAGPGVDVQAFRHRDGSLYLCLVNQNTREPVEAPLRFQAPFAARIRGVSDAATGKHLCEGQAATIHLGPGEGRLLRLSVR